MIHGMAYLLCRPRLQIVTLFGRFLFLALAMFGLLQKSTLQGANLGTAISSLRRHSSAYEQDWNVPSICRDRAV